MHTTDYYNSDNQNRLSKEFMFTYNNKHMKRTIKEEIEMYMNIAESEGADVHWLDLAQVLPYNRLTIKSIWHKRKSAMRKAFETGKYLSEQERKEFNSEFTVLMFVFGVIALLVYFLIK